MKNFYYELLDTLVHYLKMHLINASLNTIIGYNDI